MNHTFAIRPLSFILRLASCILHPRPLLMLLSLTWAILLSACGPTVVTPPTPITLRIAGSTSMLPLLSDLTAAYTERYPHVRFVIEGGDSHIGLERLERGEADLAACSWLPSAPSEESKPQPHMATPIAWDGIAIVVHPDNPLDDLTLLQVRNIYAGWTLDWQEVGGQEGEIIVVSREDGSGTRAVFERLVMGEQPVTLTAIVMPSSAAVVDYVARRTSAIGYVSMGYLTLPGRGNAESLGQGGRETGGQGEGRGLVKVLRIEGAHPTPETVREGIYHLTRPLYLVTLGESDAEARSFIDFALSPAGQAIVGQRYGGVR